MLLCNIERFIVALYFLIVLVVVLFPIVYSAKTIYRASFKKDKKAKYIDRIRYKDNKEVDKKIRNIINETYAFLKAKKKQIARQNKD